LYDVWTRKNTLAEAQDFKMQKAGIQGYEDAT
jgi:hypothetical protein